MVILLTDGEENVATAKSAGEIAPAHAAQLCEELGVRVYAIAAGGAGATGRSRPDTRPMEQLAARTGGRFYQARDADAVTGVYAAIDAMEKAPREEPRYELVERFAPVVLTALGLLLAALLAQSTVLDVLP